MRRFRSKLSESCEVALRGFAAPLRITWQAYAANVVTARLVGMTRYQRWLLKQGGVNVFTVPVEDESFTSKRSSDLDVWLPDDPDCDAAGVLCAVVNAREELTASTAICVILEEHASGLCHEAIVSAYDIYAQGKNRGG